MKKDRLFNALEQYFLHLHEIPHIKTFNSMFTFKYGLFYGPLVMICINLLLPEIKLIQKAQPSEVLFSLYTEFYAHERFNT